MARPDSRPGLSAIRCPTLVLVGEQDRGTPPELASEIAGAYRLGPTADLLPRFGVEGLYTHTLFQLRPELFARTGPAARSTAAAA